METKIKLGISGAAVFAGLAVCLYGASFWAAGAAYAKIGANAPLAAKALVAAMASSFFGFALSAAFSKRLAKFAYARQYFKSSGKKTRRDFADGLARQTLAKRSEFDEFDCEFRVENKKLALRLRARLKPEAKISIDESLAGISEELQRMLDENETSLLLREIDFEPLTGSSYKFSKGDAAKGPAPEAEKDESEKDESETA